MPYYIIYNINWNKKCEAIEQWNQFYIASDYSTSEKQGILFELSLSLLVFCKDMSK